MGTSPLGVKACRRISRDIGMPVKRAVGTGGYVFEFATFDHQHGLWSKRDGSWRIYAADGDPHIHCWSSCRWNFGDEPVPDYLCGATDVLNPETEPMHAICDIPKDRPHEKHQCGSYTWTDAA